MHGYRGWGDFHQPEFFQPVQDFSGPAADGDPAAAYAIVIHGVGYTYDQVVSGFYVDAEPDVDVVDHGFGVERRGDRWYIFDPYANFVE